MNLRLTFLLVVALMEPAQAAVLPPNAIVDGRTIGEWSAEWWKWFLPISTNHNPVLDANGAFASVGQPAGDVFLLAHVLAISPEGPVTRTFTVPETKHLFFPVLMYEADNVDTDPPLSTDALRTQAAGVVNDIRELYASLDGVALTNLFAHRALSPVFSLLYTNSDNIHSFAFGHPVTGLIDPMVCDGYWLMLEPLPVGAHVLNFGGSFSNALFFPSDISAYITVVPVSLPERVGELIAVIGRSSLSKRRQSLLLPNLRRAERRFSSGQPRMGILQLRVFQFRVRHILRHDPALRDQLIRSAQSTVDRAREGLNK